MKPSDLIQTHRAEIIRAVHAHKTRNPRIFGSTLHGDDTRLSDLDLLVEALPGATLFDLGGLQDELQTLLGITVDVLTAEDMPPNFRQKVLTEAKPL